MLIKEFIQILRDPRMKAIILVTPVLQLIVFGYAVTTGITQVATAVADFDRPQETRELVRSFERSGYFRVVRHVTDASRLRELVDRGTVKAALQFDAGFSRDLERGRRVLLQVLVDGTDPNRPCRRPSSRPSCPRSSSIGWPSWGGGGARMSPPPRFLPQRAQVSRRRSFLPC